MKLTEAGGDKDIHVSNAVWTEWRKGSVPEERLQRFYSVLHVDPGLELRVSVIVRSAAKGFGWRDTGFQDVYVR